MPSEQDGIAQYTTDELKEILESKSAQVVDVRTEEEYEEGHIPGVPLKSMQTLPEWVGTLEQSDSYVFVCRSGARSQRVASYLKQMGFEKVANYAGGMMAWNGPVESGSES